MTGLLITRRSLSDRRTALVWWAVGMLSYTAMILAVWPVIDGNEDFAELAETYPESLQAMFGGAEGFAQFTTPTGFLTTYLYSMILPLLLVGLAVSMGSALIAGEEENGLLDLLLSNPVTRRRAVAEKALAIAAALGALGVALVVLTATVGPLLDLSVGVDRLVAATLGSVLYGLLHGLLALGAGAARGPKGFATGLAWGVALVGYLLTVVANLSDSLAFLRWGSPLYYATADDPISSGVPPEYAVLVGACALVAAATVVAFERHDLS